jgi:hypothetical protein
MTTTECPEASIVEECWKSNGRFLRSIRGIRPTQFSTIQAFLLGIFLLGWISFSHVYRGLTM